MYISLKQYYQPQQNGILNVVPTVSRKNFLWCFIGHNTTGKTPTAIELCRGWRATRPASHKIIGFDPQDKFTEAGILDVRIKATDSDWARILCEKDPKTFDWRFKNSLLILDDYRMLHPSDSMDKGFMDLLALRVKMNMDIVIICHNPKLILERLSYFITHYSIFYTEAQVGSFQNRIPKYVACQQASVLVNKYVLKHGRGKYPLFPHIIIRNESDELDCINMEEEKVNALYRAA